MAQIKPLSAELQKIACDELGEVPSRISEDLAALKLWIKQQPHLHARTDDQFLIQFLRGCKYSLERAKEKLDNFNALRSKYPELFLTTDVDDPKFKENYSLGIVVPLPRPLNDCGPRIIVFRFNFTVDHSMEDIILPINAVKETLMMNDPYACINGVVYVTDLSKATTGHLLQLTPSVVKRVMTFFEKSLPLRIKALCYINAPPAAEQFFKLVISCVSEKLKQRIIICSKDITKIYGQIPQKYLPEDFGGSNGSLDKVCMNYSKVFEEYREYFKQNAEFGTDERLRPGKPLDFDTVFGTGGSFRKINVD
ncbi:alpha-tocopherol transfer protein-like [Haematobia irritans]|uniref:alpha-tocopherol transfer protein-like n=1 Tax=Haematobia irritans TaxID=7368 RepID=UPI003F5092A8